MPFSRLSTHTHLMPVLEAVRAPKTVATSRRVLRARGMLPDLDQAALYALRLDQLRTAIRNNLVSFPSQVPVFERHDRPDLQRRIVQLYFMFGWSCATIAARYGLLRQRVGQVLSTWKRRALETGYIQYIPPAERIFTPARVKIVTSRLAKGSGAQIAVERRDVRPSVSCDGC